ncbi:potassium channel family protein [Marinobacter arenosus]|uniref:potassium channel family protein n=1 Tax=Marinobacter arenosus TaxID=2856822 RepID=UPI001C4BF460|nr:potassium channel family protein [Marinobacter arenosus]MBW0148395.1 potassium channel family protein [Marinobacter arenosus]
MTVNEHVGLINVTLINALIVAAVVLIHHESLIRLSGLLSRMRQSHHFRIIVAVLGILVAHTVQVWIFAAAYYFLHHVEGWGELVGNFNGSLLDCAYFSFTTFTTLGYGDIQALGHLRYLTGIEALTGLVLITWSASFLFVEMQRYWPTR